jgi:class 3 adenylate cyclase/tetratricopeptide (TPR) repeat protein
MTGIIETLSSYVPALVAGRLANNPTPVARHDEAHFSAAVLHADIAGFTPLTERLSQDGPEGIDRLSSQLNAFFGELIELVSAHGGDIVKFAGDSLVAIWPSEENPGALLDLTEIGDQVGGGEYLLHPSSLGSKALRAAQCACAIQSRLHENRQAQAEQLTLEIGLSAGAVMTTHLGGKYGRWEFLLAGKPVGEAARAEAAAAPGQVMMSKTFWSLVQAACSGSPSESEFMLLHSVDQPIAAEPLKRDPLGPKSESSLRAYIPGPIMSRIAAGQSDWLAEHRRVSLIFTNLPDLGYDSPIEDIQRAVHMLQEALYSYEGTVSKIALDHTGLIFVAALGLHPLAHEDDPVLAGLAAIEMRDRIRPLNLRCSIGVSTGSIFCGSIGNDKRRDYTLIGDAVNLGARIMKAVGSSPYSIEQDIYVDDSTFEQSEHRIEFEDLPMLSLEGREEQASVFRPLRERQIDSRRVSSAELFGRADERSLLADALQKLLRGQDSFVLIEGEAGIGKSKLVRDLIRQAQSLEVGVLIGAGDAVERQTAYRAWRDPLQQIFGIEASDTSQTQTEKVKTYLSKHEEWLRMSPLLKDLLLIDIPENSWTSQMHGTIRADNTRDFLLRLILDSATSSPLVLILEDTHWMDTASWSLTQAVANQLSPLMLVVISRPYSEAPPEAYLRYARRTSLTHIQLDALGETETIELVQNRLGANQVPDEVIQLILEKGEGNPFFSEELTYALRDAGFIRVADGICELAPDVSLDQVSLPDTVQGVVTSRIDRLEPAQQMLLKIASVIGKLFNRKLLQEVYPIAEDKPHLQDHLAALKALDLAERDDRATESIYSFKHAITQEVAYNLMTYGQRQEMHLAVAKWYEVTYADPPSVDLRPEPDLLVLSNPNQAQQTRIAPYLPLLVYHFHHAGEEVEERHYARLAGKHSAAHFANSEAIVYLTRALELTDDYHTDDRFDLILSREHVFDLQGRREEQLADLLKLTQLADLAGTPEKRSAVALRLANYYETIGDYEATIIAARNALQLVRSLDAPDLQATAHLHWGRALNQRGEYRYARDHLDTALALVHTFSESASESLYPQDTPDAHLYPIKAESLRWLGEVSWNEGDFAQAKFYYERSLFICRETGDRRRECYLLDHLGFVSWSQDDLSRANSYYQKGLEIFREIGDPQGEGNTLNHLGSVAERQRSYSAATSYYRQALDIFREIGYRRGEAEVFLNLGFVSLHQANHLAGQAYFSHANFTFKEIGLRRGESLSMAMLGLCALRLDELNEAVEYCNQAIEITNELEETSIEAYALTHLGHALLALNQFEQAGKSYQQAYQLRRDLAKPSLANESLAGFVRVLIAQGNLPEAYMQAESILKFLEGGDVSGTLEPFLIYWSCYTVLRAFQDTRKKGFLEMVVHKLFEQASKISKDSLRKTFLEEIPHHNQIVLAWEDERRR